VAPAAPHVLGLLLLHVEILELVALAGLLLVGRLLLVVLHGASLRSVPRDRPAAEPAPKALYVGGMALIMPAEWEPHARCLIAWPGRDLVSTRLLTAVKADCALVARAIADFEPVLMIAGPGFGREAAAYCGDGVDVVELPLEEAWLRDSGPLFVRSERTAVVAVDFLFNGWGRTLPAPRHETSIGARLAEWLGVERRVFPVVLEGGAVTTDGEGTLIAIETSIRHENRNPGVSRSRLEHVFREFLGIGQTIWLEHGLLEDRTGGHVDNVAAFVGPGRVLCQTIADRDDPNYSRLAANRAVLEAAVDARGRHLEIVDLDVLPYRDWAGRRIALPYVNFYLGSGCAIVPLACLPSDREGLARLREVFPDREIVGVPATNLARRGGGAHCITQQLPLASPGASPETKKGR
jgi:agmatine deiminase